MWYKTTEKKPEGYAGIILYRRDRNKFNEGNWEEGIDMVIVDNLPVPLTCFDVWCYRMDLFHESNLGELVHSSI